MRNLFLYFILIFCFLINSELCFSINEANLKNLINNKEYSQVENILQEYLQKNPADIEKIIQLATIYSWDNKLDLALITYNRVLAFEPKNLSANLGIARVLSWQGKYNESINVLSNQLINYPSVIEIYVLMGRIYRWNSQLIFSENILKKGLAISVNNFDLLYELGLTYLEQNNFQASYDIFNQLNQIDPNNEQIKQQLKNTKMLLNPVFTAGYYYIDSFDINYLKNNQNKKITDARFNFKYNQNIFPHTNLELSFLVGNETQTDVFVPTQDYELVHNIYSLNLKYNFVDLFDFNFISQVHQFADTPGSNHDLDEETPHFAVISGITKKLDNNRFDLFFSQEIFPLIRGIYAQIFSSTSYGMSFYRNITSRNGLGIAISNNYFTSYNGYRQYYLFWTDNTFIKDGCT